MSDPRTANATRAGATDRAGLRSPVKDRGLRLAWATIACVLLAPASVSAEGVLNIYNWGNYTSLEMIAKFEAEHDVKVTLTDYDSSDAALAKVRAGGHGFDIAIIGANFLPIWAEEGLLMESNPTALENFSNIEERWVNQPYDPGNRYSVPWNWGLTGVLVDTAVYDGDIDTMSIILDPPPELQGRIAVLPDMNDVIYSTIRYLGGEQCTGDIDLLRQVRDKLIEAKEHWVAIDFGVVEKMAARDYAAAFFYNGAAMRARESNPTVRFGYPVEGFPFYMDSAAILATAKNVENAKLFMSFILEPENAAMLSNYTRSSNAIKGSDAFMDASMRDAPELQVPDQALASGEFLRPCPPEVNDIYTQIWTEVLQ